MESAGVRTVLGMAVDCAGTPCAGCGRSITDPELETLIRTYISISRICAFCGRPIRPISGSLTHHHRTEANTKRPMTSWDFQGYVDEPSFTWLTHERDFSIDMAAHLSCARQESSYADWDGLYQEPVVHPGRVIENLDIESPCRDCGSLITEAEQAAAVRWLLKVQAKPCACCGQDIRILKALIAHRWHGEPCKYWAMDDWTLERTVNWCAPQDDGKGHYRSVSCRAHLDCAQVRLKHADWTPPLRRRPWLKQDWSSRIEPWFRGIIKGEAPPDWGRMMEPAEIRRLWREK